jgi:hypothetical protein
MAFTRIMQTANTMHLPKQFRDEAEKLATIRTLQAELFRAVGGDIASLRNRITKAQSIGVREKSFGDPATRA